VHYTVISFGELAAALLIAGALVLIIVLDRLIGLVRIG
jgi:hypothetical protein